MRLHKKSNRTKGFTLIEMMIIVVIVAILAAIALPSYQDYVRKARRSDGLDALLHVQTLEEKWRASNISYSNSLTGIGYGNTSTEGHYALAFTGTPNATSYTVTATGGTIQTGDAEGAQPCTTLTLAVTPTTPRGVKTPTACWD